MFKHYFVASLCLLFACDAARAEGRLTAQEIRWLTAAGPVLAYAQRLKLPIDITVQPQSSAHDVPLAMGFDGQRCKLVLSIRGNPDAEAIFAQAPQIERTLLIEVMTAHEVGHCWRYAHGVWHALPAGFNDAGVAGADKMSLPAEAKAMRETRREEGYADLVALAWTARNHPRNYAQVYGWLESVRRAQPAAGGAHDTGAWVRLARDAGVFGPDATPFEQVAALWRQGLLGE